MTAPDFGPHADYVALLRRLLQTMRQADEAGDYETRYRLSYYAVGVALAAGYKAGFQVNGPRPEDPKVQVAFIELPTGQVSWWTPTYGYPHDGHTPEEQEERIRDFCHPRKGTPRCLR